MTCYLAAIVNLVQILVGRDTTIYERVILYTECQSTLFSQLSMQYANEKEKKTERTARRMLQTKANALMNNERVMAVGT